MDEKMEDEKYRYSPPVETDSSEPNGGSYAENDVFGNEENNQVTLLIRVPDRNRLVTSCRSNIRLCHGRWSRC